MYITEEYRSRKASEYGNGVIFNDEPRYRLPELLDFMEEFTEVYKANKEAHPAIREAACFRVQYPATLLGIAENDLFAGRFDVFPLGIGHQFTNGEFGFVIRHEWFDEMQTKEDVTREQKERLGRIHDFWKIHNTIQKMEDRQPLHEKAYMPYPNWSAGPASVLPSYRIAGLYLDYEKLLELGLNGLIDEVDRSEQCAECKDGMLFEGIRESLQLVQDIFRWYANLLRNMEAMEKNDDRRAELKEMARICRKLSHSRPDTFREALQLVFLYSAISGVREWGRMDDYLAEYYAHDLANGIITEEKALECLISFWRMIVVKEQITDDRIVIGGKGRRHEVNADKLAMLIMETSRIVKDTVPQLTLRFYEGQNPMLYEKALDCIGEGCTFPMLYSDDVIIPGIMKVFGVDETEAEAWLPFGCGEFIIDHRRINTPNSFINLSNVLLATLNHGRELEWDTRLSPDRGELTDYDTYEALFEAYKQNVDDLMDIGAAIQGRSYRTLSEDMSINLVTVLYDECLKRGKGLIDGGIPGKDGCCEMYGLITASDSLYAIKKLVYEDKKISKETLLAALKANFKGYEKEQALLLDAPKFGNDIDEVDDIMKQVHELVCFSSLSKSGKYGLDRFTIVNINNKGNTIFGRLTGATPNGRVRGDSLSNGNNPTSGMDKNGMTAFLKSLLKARTDIHAGVVQNMKFSKEVFGELLEAVAKPLLETYFKNGGAQAMITVIGKEDLENAMKHPEQYAGLIVRVGGFSARFIELDHDIQMDILNRTAY